MNLGETIYKLRTEKNLSQGDLAELLEVSRQSISKWENNSAVPELEKIVKLSEIFGVSLDVLVKGEERIPETRNTNSVRETEKKEQGFPPRKIAGTVLLCMAFLVTLLFLIAGGGLGGIFFALPFLACGVICFAFRKNVGLWCAWAVYVLVDIYISYATGISRASVLYTFQWTYNMNYMRLAFAWILLLSLIAIIAVTAVRLGKSAPLDKRKERTKLIAAWGIVVVLQAAAMIWPCTPAYQYIVENIFAMEVIYRLVTVVLSWTRIIAVTIAMVYTVRFMRSRASQNGD